MAARNLVIGFSTNMEAERVRALCRSIRAIHSARETEIVLITDDPAGHAEALRGLDVSFHPTPCDGSRYPGRRERWFKKCCVHAGRLLAGGVFDRLWCRGAVERFLPVMLEAAAQPQTGRWFAYASVLKSRPYAERVLLADVKDVIVQGDWFAGLEPGRVKIFEEDVRFSDGTFNDKWVREGFGQAAYDSVKGLKVICTGTVLGGGPGMARFLAHVGSMFRRYPFRTIDQGTMNWLWFKEGIPDYVDRVPNVVGEVATLSNAAAVAAVESREGRIVRRADGSTIPIVHMWDRWPEFRESVLKTFQADPSDAPPAAVAT